MGGTYTKLIVWQKSIDLVEQVYLATQGFPETERYGLISQMRRSAVSVPSNIAEGHGRKSKAEFMYFLRIAFGSTSELETQLVISHRLKMLESTRYEELSTLLTMIRKMLNKLMAHTKQPSN